MSWNNDPPYDPSYEEIVGTPDQVAADAAAGTIRHHAGPHDWILTFDDAGLAFQRNMRTGQITIKLLGPRGELRYRVLDRHRAALLAAWLKVAEPD